MPTGKERESLIEEIECFRALLTGFATGGDTDATTAPNYEGFRKRLMANAETAPRLPDFVKRCRTLSDFWTFIKPRVKTYQERREFLLQQLDPLLTYLESQRTSLSAEPILAKLDSDHVRTALQRVSVRVASDPEGAMTAGGGLHAPVADGDFPSFT